MEIKAKVLGDIISLVSTNMTGEVETTPEIVRTVYQAGGKVVHDFRPEYTIVELGGVKFRTNKINLQSRPPS